MSSPLATPARTGWLVARGEGAALWAAAGAYFCLLSGYYMLRSLREAMALEAGRESIPALFTIVLCVQLAILPLYWWIVARTPRRRLFVVLYVPVVLLFSAIAVGMALHGPMQWLAATYFVAVTSVNLFMVSVFWSVMADRWSPQAAKRLFGFIAAGGSVGALAGPLINALAIERLGAPALIFIACALLLGAVVLAGIVQAKSVSQPSVDAPPIDQAVGGRAIDDLRRFVSSPYLLAIAGLIAVGQILGAFVYNEQARLVEDAYQTLAARTALFARVDLAVNLVALAFQAGVVGWLATRAGPRVALSAMPVVVGLSFVALALLPTLLVFMVTQVVRRAADYGLSKPTREMLYTVLNPESKFKTKSLLDTVLQRGADTVGNWLYVLLAAAGIGLVGFAWIGALACFALIGVTWRLGTSFERRT